MAKMAAILSLFIIVALAASDAAPSNLNNKDPGKNGHKFSFATAPKVALAQILA